MFNEVSYQDTTTLEVVSDFVERPELSDKKQNGVYYTPEKGARILTQWAIRDQEDYVLEPSFGGCEFLKATKERLVQLGCAYPESRLYGCDVDPNAFDFLRALLPTADTEEHFKHIDFLSVPAKGFPKVDAIIGNPPYVSRHNMTEQQCQTAWTIADSLGVTLSKKASLWAYFVLHSLSFLKEGGRIAWILPGSFIYADYSIVLREKIEKAFNRSLAVVLQERLFMKDGTEETSVILLCEGFKAKKTEKMRIAHATVLDQLQTIVNNWNNHEVIGSDWGGRPQISMLSESDNLCYSRLVSSHSAHRLAEYVTLTIGIVTGKSGFFVVTDKTALKHSLPQEVLEPIISKFAHCAGAEVTYEDLQELRESDKRCLLINTLLLKEENIYLNKYLDSFPEGKRLINKTFKKRVHWHQPDDGIRPDGFFSCMQSFGPVLVLNSAQTLCTNSVYRAAFSADASLNLKKAIAVSLQSTLSQFSAEIEGRSYGSGALKLEPSEAKKIVLLVPEYTEDITIVFEKIDSFLRENNRNAARSEADAYLVRKNLISPDDLSILSESLDKLRQSRKVIRSKDVL